MNYWAIFGFILCFGLVNMTYGLPLSLVYAGIFLKKQRLSAEHTCILILTLIKVFWILAVHFLYSNKELFSLAQLLSQDAIILLMLFVKITRSDFAKFAKPVIILFLIDFSFNVSMAFFGVDLLGRVGGYRPDDIIRRLGGLFNNPVYSVSITTVALIIGLFLKKKWLVYTAVICFVMNGSQRAPLTLILVLFVAIVLKLKLRRFLVYPLYYIFAACVFGITIFSASRADYISGNFLRVLAWTNSIEMIRQSPLVGNHDFIPGPLEGMSPKVIIDYGIAESPYLQLALDYGLPPAILSFYVLYLISRKWINLYQHNPDNSSYFVIAIFSSVIFVDRFYGSLFGGMLLTFIYCALCICYQEHNKSTAPL